MSGSPVLDRLGDLGVIPVVVIDAPSRAEVLGSALLLGGLPCAEVTFRTAAAAARVATRFGREPRPAGRRRDRPSSRAGARRPRRRAPGYVVSPGSRRRWSCVPGLGVPVVPGVATATEVIAALDAGLDL